MAETINLIPQEERVEQVRTKMVKLSTVLTIVLLILIALISGYFFYRAYKLKQSLKQLESEIGTTRGEISNLTNIEINARNLFRKSETLRSLFAERSYFSRMMVELEKSVPQGIVVESFGLGKDNTVSISGTAENYNDVQAFSNKILETDLFTQVQLNSVGLENNSQKVNYFIIVTYKPELLHE